MKKLTKAEAALKIIEIVRDDKYVSFKYNTSDLAVQEHSVKFIEQPTPEFDTALQKLALTACGILEYGDPEGITVVSLTIRRTKSGTKSAIIGFYKALASVDNPHLMENPQFRVEQPAENEQGVRQCIESNAQDIFKMIELAKAYIAGERLQTLLPLVEEGEDEDGERAPTEEEMEKTKGRKLRFDAEATAS
jgi:hypothetical protein